MAKIIDGKALAAGIKESLKEQVAQQSSKIGRKPGLAVIIVGENPASQTYVRNKVSSALYIGMESRKIELPETVSEAELLSQIEMLNNDPLVDGLLVQLPLPKHINEEKVIDAISFKKDVDGFHPMNVANLWIGKDCTVPCTPKGIMRLIDETGINLSGKNAVIVGRSNIVGKPVAKLLLDRNATVTIAHSRTEDLASVTSAADILVVAVGRQGVVTGEMIKPGAVVIDVGINRGEDGKLHGDVDFESASDVAGYITPVPGGVGPMTIAMLLENTFESFLRYSQK